MKRIMRSLGALALLLSLCATPVVADATIADGNKAVTAAGTAEALSATSQLVVWITIQADTDNTGAVFVGASTIEDGRGVELSAGESMTFPLVDKKARYNLNEIYVDVTVNGEAVSYVYMTR